MHKSYRLGKILLRSKKIIQRTLWLLLESGAELHNGKAPSQGKKLIPRGISNSELEK
jgi:hypothetical protein